MLTQEQVFDVLSLVWYVALRCFALIGFLGVVALVTMRYNEYVDPSDRCAVNPADPMCTPAKEQGK